MTDSSVQPKPSSHSTPPICLGAWIITLLVSPLADIFFYELTGAIPAWLFWIKAALLGIMIWISSLRGQFKPLRPYLIMLLAITALMRMNAWLLELPAKPQSSYAVILLAAQLLEIGMALILIGVLFWLRKRPQEFFLVYGERPAMLEPVRWLGQKKPSLLWQFGLIFTLVVIVGQVFLLILPLSPTPNNLLKLVPMLPLILLLAATNGFTEEIILRVAPIAPAYQIVGKDHAIWMAAVLFGLSHYIGGAPSGIPGVMITTILGWFFGKCLLDSKGFFWPWLFHAIQDILPFAFMILAVLAREG